ncbi:hypothetical protein INS49_014554 [Diaporthe citri]|uniref:uncharacterized protein n=1 Tax=Diaporthe citri TaxID=83186 RepID=UPI001C81CA56|nr:uncharacterized protein INS49_014554 [Diaporthe citri]KAG6356680.1 hypothetical protein INS49_014554 [Diaporthe citri]
MLVVQSVQTGELLVQKLVRPNTDDPDYEYEEPLELRISTWQDTLPSNGFPNYFANNVFINYPPRRVGGRTARVGEESSAFPQIVLGDFGNSAADGDDTMIIPLNVLGGEDPGDTELRLWEDTYGVGNTLRRLCQAHLPISPDDGDVGDADWHARRPNNIRMAGLNARDASAPDFSAQLVDLLGNFEWDAMETGTDIHELEDPLGDVTADSRWMVDTLYPAARARVAAYRNPPGGRPARYFDGLDVSWTKPEPVMPFVYNTSYAHHEAAAADAVGYEDGEGGGGVDVNWNDKEEVKMQALGRLHKWDDVKPSYELRSLEFNGPTIRPSNQPPGGE